jgi:uncharacterized protein (DUF305 family)
MTKLHALRLTRCLGAALITACAGSTQGAAPATQAPQPATSTTTAATVPQGRDAAYAKARADSLRYPYTAADVHFMSGMISHHAQAIQMSRMAPTHGASPAVQRLADRIINAQQDEIATMQGWLAARRQPVPEAKPGPMKMKMGNMEHEMLMPGMLTEEQVAQLDRARGPDFDRLFLTYMIQHHRGATSMVRDLFGSPGAAQDETVFKFANDVNVDQTTEIARMQTMLSALLFGSSAP